MPHEPPERLVHNTGNDLPNEDEQKCVDGMSKTIMKAGDESAVYVRVLFEIFVRMRMLVTPGK